MLNMIWMQSKAVFVVVESPQSDGNSSAEGYSQRSWAYLRPVCSHVANFMGSHSESTESDGPDDI
jgi:hypothetical protein